MTDGSNNGLLLYVYSYHHPYYGHLYAESTVGIAYPTWPQSVTAWSTGDQSLPFLIPSTYITATTFVDDKEDPTAAISGD